MKTLKNILGLGLAALTFTACSDVADEITELTLGRNLSPIDIQAKNVNETTANLQWKAVDGASSYYIEVFADDSLTFEGTPEQTLTSETNSISLSKLNFDTKYSARVQAINENETRNSKFHGVFFRTSAKQFLKNPKPTDITDRGVTLTWEVEDGFDVSTIVIGSVTYTITENDKAAGQATIEGLSPETTYTAYLYYNGKQCGNRNFTTIADLEGTTQVHPEDDLTTLLKEAEAGEVFTLFPGTYMLNLNDETGKTSQVEITQSITIKGIYPTAIPVIQGRFGFKEGAALTLNQVKLDGSINSSTDQAFVYKNAGDFGALTVTNSTIMNYEKGVLYNNTDGITIEKVIFDKCIFENIVCTNDMFDVRKAWIGEFTISNSTIFKSCANRSMIRFDNGSPSYPGKADPVVKLENCTIDGVETAAFGTSNMNGLTYVRYAGHKILVSNNLITNSTGGCYSRNANTNNPTFTNNYYYNCGDTFFKNLATDGSELPADASGKNGDDPKYKDAANGDFTLGNEDVAKLKVGDPRWYTAQ